MISALSSRRVERSTRPAIAFLSRSDDRMLAGAVDRGAIRLVDKPPCLDHRGKCQSLSASDIDERSAVAAEIDEHAAVHGIAFEFSAANSQAVMPVSI